MLSLWQATADFFHHALEGGADPWVLALVLAMTTLLLEDLAIAAGAALATQGMISWELAFLGVAGGIAAGDVGLYGLGMAANRVPWLRRRYIDGRTHWAEAQLRTRLGGAVMLARVVPGLRLVTYTACGFFKLPLAQFSAWVTLAVSVWTAGLFWLSSAVGSAIAASLNIPLGLAVAIPVVGLVLVVWLVQWMRSRWMRTQMS